MAGFVQFDPDKWEPSDGEGVAKVAKVAKVAPRLASLASLAALPADVANGLERLSRMAVPRLRDPERWPGTVSDALKLASDGWAITALRLGWTELEVFGAVTDKHGDPNADGLAVKLDGRRVLAICDRFATVRDADGGRSYIGRGNTDGAVLMWDLGHRRHKANERV